jgi:hypothetical protein
MLKTDIDTDITQNIHHTLTGNSLYWNISLRLILKNFSKIVANIP